MERQGEQWDKKPEVLDKEKTLVLDKKREDFKRKKAHVDEKRKAEKDRRDFVKGKYTYESNSDNPPDPHGEDARVEEHYFWEEKSEREKAEQEALRALKEKHEAEIRDVLENVDITKLDTQNRAAVHAASIANIVPDTLSKEIKEEALKGITWPDGKPVDVSKPLSPEQAEMVKIYVASTYAKEIKEEALQGITWPDGKPVDVSKPLSSEQAEMVRLHVASTYLRALSNFSADDLKDAQKLAEIEKEHPGITDFIKKQPDLALLSQKTFFEAAEKDRTLLKGFVDSVERNGMLMTGITPTSKLGKELVKVIKDNIDEYTGIHLSQEGLVDVEHFKWLKDVVGASYMDLLFSREFLLGDDHPLKKSRDVILEGFHDAMAEKAPLDPKTATPEEMSRYQQAMKDEFGKATGVEWGKVEKAIKHISRNQLSPFFRFLADIFAPFGALVPGKAGDFWREYLANKDKGNGDPKYTEGRSTPFEGKWVENASSSAIHAAAKKYEGMNEAKNASDIREMHKSAGLNAGAGTPWCMSFVQHVLRRDMWFNSSQIWSPTASAADGHKIGRHTDTPKPWDIVLIYRSGGSGRHIGFVDSMNADGSVNVLWGNQSDSVCVTRYSRSSVAEFRTLETGESSVAQGDGGETWHEWNQDTLPESKGTVDKVVSYQESLRLMADPSTPKYDEKWRLIIYKVDPNGYKRDAATQATYNTNIARGDKDKRFIAVHGTASDYGVSGWLTDEKLDQSGFHQMLNTGLYPYFISKKGIVFSTTENDANHPACVNDKANTITGYDRLNNKGIAIEMSLRADGNGSVEKPNQKQMQSGRDLILALRGKYNIGAGNVITSKDPVRDPVTGEFKGEHSDDFDDAVRDAMGIAKYADTARRFREKTFFTDALASNKKLESASGGNYNIRLKPGDQIDVTASSLNAILWWNLQGAWQHFIDAGKMYGIQPRFLAAISMHETGNGTSPKSQTGNLMGISDKDGAIDYSNQNAVMTYFRSRDLKHHSDKWKYASIYDQAYKLTYYEPYKGKDTLSQVQSVYAPTPADWPVQNDSRNLNRFWLWKVGEWMGKIS